MNAATLLVLGAVVAVVAVAAYRVIRMVLSNDMCYACPGKGCKGCSNPINCQIREK